MKTVFILTLLFCSMSVFAETSDSSTFYFQKGMEEKAAKRWLVAAGYFDKATSFNPKFTDAYIESGYVNLEMRRTDEAMRKFTKANEIDPLDNTAIKELAGLYYSYRQFKRAIEFANKCIDCENKNRIIAMSYFQMEDYANAEKNLFDLIIKDPKDAEVTYTLARTYLEMGLEGKAIPFYETAVMLDETKSKWSFELGLIYYNNANYKNAVVYFNKAVAQGFVQSNDFNENLGFSYIYSGEHEKGEKLLSEIISRKPGDKEFIRDVALAFYDSKLYDKSLDYCQKLLEMDKNDGKALYQAGLCFQKKGQKDKGQQMCDRAIELDPSLGRLRQKKQMMGM